MRNGSGEALQALARAAGIVDEYYDPSHGEVRRTPAHTATVILRAMGLDASSDESALQALESVRQSWADVLCDAVRVLRGNEDLSLNLALPWQFAGFTYELEVRREDGEILHAGAKQEGNAGHSPRERRLFRIDTGLSLPNGYHDARIRVTSGSEVLEATQRLIVTPWKCREPAESLGEQRAFGFAANLYSVRGQNDVGMGNLTTLAELCRWARAQDGAGARAGRGAAAFVGINPLHALRNRDDDVGPYSPSSRLFRNILYIDARNVPEFAASENARQMLCSVRVVEAIARLRAAEQVQYEALLDLLLPVLRALHDFFYEQVRPGDSDRARSYHGWCERQGTVLDNFATFEVLTASLRGTTEGDTVASDWRKWPASLRYPFNAEVRRFASQNERELDFHRYLQFELDRQLSAVQREARASGMAIGLYGDLALASSGRGFDAWAFPDHFVQSVSVGAPPDAFAAEGQTWGCPPVSPLALRADRYDYWIRVLRSAFEHSGMLRIDHVMGMWRQFWVPDGISPRNGTYVRYPTDDLLGILALESERAHALVVGEDLGTVPPEVRPALRDRAILSSKVFYFERTESGSFAAPEDYSELSLASVNTHDLVPLAGWWLGADLMAQFSHLPEPRRAQELKRGFLQREWERQSLVIDLVNRGLIDEAMSVRLRAIHYGVPIAESDRELLATLGAAVHEMICRSSSVLVSLALDDVALETEAVNRPGVPMSEFRSWSRKMGLSLSRDA